MAKNKTTQTALSVSDFIQSVKEEAKQQDCKALINIIQQQTQLEPTMWGTSIIGFGSYHYQYASGHEGDSPLIAFAPRATALVLYLSGAFEQRTALLAQLGKHKTDKGCIYIKKLADVNIHILQKIIAQQVLHIQAQYPNLLS